MQEEIAMHHVLKRYRETKIDALEELTNPGVPTVLIYGNFDDSAPYSFSFKENPKD